MNDEKILEEAVKAASKELVHQAYADVRSWMTSVARWIKTKYEKVTTEVYRFPEEFLHSLKTNKVHNGDRVTVECKPALFGPFLRTHFISPIIGNHTGMRLGPPMQANHPAIAMIAQITSHLTPVGLYPSIDDSAQQACLYASDANACGFVGLFPGINDLVTYLPALLAPRHTTFCNMSCNLTGTIRMIDAHALVEAGFTPEIYEEIRQLGEVWFIDATDDDSECNPLGDAVTTELWGGFYASGHLEMASGELKINRAVDALVEAISSEGFKPRVVQNKGRGQEIMIFSEGIRINLDSRSPFYSLHMDADLGLNFGGARNKFDSVSTKILENISLVCKEDSVDLRNDHDLDFSYTDGTKTYSVMKSLGANQIKDPLAVAIRDWHRKRGK